MPNSNFRLESFVNKEKHGIRVERHIVDKDYSLHFHEFYEIEFVISGKGYTDINGVKHELNPNTITFMSPLDFHSITVEEPITMLCVHLTSSNIEHSFFPHMQQATLIHDFPDFFIKKLFEESRKNRPFNQTYIQSLINCVIIEIFRVSEKRSQNSRLSFHSSDITQRLQHYIKMNYHKPISMEILSSEFGYSCNYLSDIFHKNIGLTIKEYTAEIRLNAALKLLCSSELSVTDICFAVGYTSISNFLRAFKSKFNITPNEYRRINREDGEEDKDAEAVVN